MAIVRERLLPVIEAINSRLDQAVGWLENAKVSAVEDELVALGHVRLSGVEWPNAQDAGTVQLILDRVVESLHGVEPVNLLLVGHRSDATSAARQRLRDFCAPPWRWANV